MVADTKEIFEMMIHQRILISYTGSFDSQILAVMAKNIEYTLLDYPKVSKKLFKIFIELAQNISLYSAEKVGMGDNSGVGTLVIKELDNYFTFATGNVVKTDEIVPVIEKCQYINTLDREQLRAFKRDQRNLPQGTHDGANIGLIQVALTASHPLEFKIVNIDDELSFYAVAIRIDKDDA